MGVGGVILRREPPHRPMQSRGHQTPDKNGEEVRVGGVGGGEGGKTCLQAGNGYLLYSGSLSGPA